MTPVFILGVLIIAYLWLLLEVRSSNPWLHSSQYSQVEFSLTYLDPDRPEALLIRTLHDMDLAALNACSSYQKLGRDFDAGLIEDTVSNMEDMQKHLLLIKGKKANLILQTMHIVLSKQFAHGTLMHAVGSPVRKVHFLFALACEMDDGSQKKIIRLVLVEESQLDAICDAANLQFEQSSHEQRVKTLQEIRETMNDDQWKHLVMRIELAVPCG